MARGVQRGYLGGACGLCGLIAVAAMASTPPDPGTAVDVWMRVRGDIDGHEIDLTQTDPPTAVQLILRHRGRPLASTWGARAAGHADPVRHATVALLDKARSNGMLVRLPPDLIDEGLRGTTLEAETAGAFEPLTAATLEAIADDLNPAADGIALRVGNHWHVRFPSAMRMTGSAATLDTLHELAAVAELSTDALREARQTGHAALYRFSTIDLVQRSGERMPHIFNRGESVTSWICDRTAMLGQLENIVVHLGTHFTTPTTSDSNDTTILGGTYLPHSDRWKPVIASPSDWAIARLAFLTAAKTPDLDPLIIKRSLQWAEDCSLYSPTADQLPVALRLECAVSPSEKLLERATSLLDNANATPSDRALAAWALAGHRSTHPHVRAFLNEITLLPPSQLMHMLPWLGWADIRLAAADNCPPRLTPFWNLLSTRIATTIGDTTTPTADMLPLTAFLASAAGDRNIYPATEQADASQVLCRSLELLDLLVVDLDEAQFYPAPSTMQGGVRLSPWDERMPIWAQAMAIMMLHEALKAMPVTVQSGEMTP